MARIKKAKSEPKKIGVNSVIKVAGRTPAGRSIDVPADWKKSPKDQKVKDEEFQGLQVYQAVDPYTTTDRKAFRTAMGNVYVYRASRILTTFVAGQGYITSIIPRIEEELTDDEKDIFKQQVTYIPYWDEELTFDELKDRIDKMAIDMDLAGSVFNGYLTSLEQGRCVLALTPINYDDETGKYPLPKEIRYIRPEFTLRPIIDSNTQELQACYVVSSRSTVTPSAIDAKRMIYLMHSFNLELFSDYYGDSKLARIADIANNLNLVLDQDYERVAESTWHQPKVWGIPIPPQEVGNEENVIAEFLTQNNENAKGRDIAVAMSSVNDERAPLLLNTNTNSGDIGGLETIRSGLIKAIITAFGIPAFMLSEGDVGGLGGTAQIEEIDMFINTEVRPERIKLENMLERQFYDTILCILYDVEDPDDLPVKIKHKYNKPTLLTLLKPEMINSLMTLIQGQMIDPSSVLEILHMEQYNKETNTKGETDNPSEAEWRDNEWKGQGSKGELSWNSETNTWHQAGVEWSEGTRWNSSPSGSWYNPSLRWSNGGVGAKTAKRRQRTAKIVNKIELPKQETVKTVNKSPIGEILPTEQDLADPQRKIQWAKVLEARKISDKLDEGV